MHPIANLGSLYKNWLTQQVTLIEEHVTQDVVSITGPLLSPVDHVTRLALESLQQGRKDALLVILTTTGGIVEIVERIATVLRQHYPQEVLFLVPDAALSAGTVLVMSGDAILMDYFSCLGPVDPQIQRPDGSLIPARSYLHQYHLLREQALRGELTAADITLLNKLDLAELHSFELATELSTTLIREWLIRYKFKNWSRTETRQIPVTTEMRSERAEQIAAALSDNRRWRTHGRGINMETLQNELNLKIDDYGADSELRKLVLDYLGVLRELMNQHQIPTLVHTRTYL